MRLVILGSSITALAVARDAQSHGMQPVVVDTEAGIAFRSRWVKPVRVADVDAHEALAAVVSFGGNEAALVATGDRWLRFVIDKRQVLDVAFAQILHPSNVILQVCLRKDAFSHWCHLNRLPTPPSWVPDASARPQALDFPLLIRPSETLHDRAHLGLPKAVEVHAERDLREWIQRFRSAGIAPIVSASLLSHRLTQYSVPFARNAAGMLSFVTRKLRPDPGQCAQGSLVEWRGDGDAAPIEQLALRAAECADYHGIGEAEILHSHDSGESYLIEINARPWLQYALAPATGHDLLGLMLQAPSANPRVSRCTQKTWINLRDDRFNAMSPRPGGAREGSLGPLAYLRSVARSNVYAVFDVRDPMPFFHALVGR